MKTLRILQAAIVLLSLLALNGCQTTSAPAAQTPSSAEVLAVLVRGGGFVNVGRTNGAFEILPGGLPSGGFQLDFNAPYPSSLRITIDGADLPRFDAIASGTNPAATGYFKIKNLNVNQTPTRWSIIVRPPDSKLGSLAYELRVFNVSANPNFAANTPEHESAPLIVSLVAQRVYTLTVLHDGTGLGHVDSTPAGINCGADCLADFGQSFTVDLVPRPAQGSRFDGWESSCTAPSTCRCTGGPTATCSITLNGTAATATAKFVPRTPPPPMAGCPGPRADAGLIFVGLPSCATTTIDMHPQAFLACDVQGFFCCEPGGNDQRCVGGGKRQFPADCMRHGNRAGPPPSAPFDGCYTRTGP